MYFEKPKIKNGKLIAKGRLTPRGCYDPERFEYRNDSPAVSKATLFTFLTMVLCYGWEIGKVTHSQMAVASTLHETMRRRPT